MLQITSDGHVYVSVLPHAYLQNHVTDFAKFLCMLPVTVARLYSGGTAIRYILPVLLTTTRHLRLPEKVPFSNAL